MKLYTVVKNIRERERKPERGLRKQINKNPFHQREKEKEKTKNIKLFCTKHNHTSTFNREMNDINFNKIVIVLLRLIDQRSDQIKL